MINCKNIKKPDFIFMDWDNTIIGTNLVCMASFNKLFADFKIDKSLTLNDVVVINNKRFDTVFKDYFIHANEHEQRGLLEKYRAIYKECLPMLEVLPNADKFLAFLEEQKIPKALLSNKPNIDIQGEIAKFNLGKYFQYATGIIDGVEEKPHQDLYNLCCKELKIQDPKSKNIWFVGDSHSDILFAKNCGMIAIFVGPREENFLTRYEKEIQNGTLIYFDQDYLNIIEQIRPIFA